MEVCFNCGFENGQWRNSRVVELEVSGRFVDGTAGYGENLVKEGDAVVFQRVILRFDVAKESNRVGKIYGVYGNLVCVQLDGFSRIVC